MKKYEKPSIKVFVLKTRPILAGSSGSSDPVDDVHNEYSDGYQL